MKRIGLALLVLSLGACEGSGTPAGVAPVNGFDYEVYKLFEVDGCKVYRFKDGGRARYFSDCGKVDSCFTQTNGKTHTTHCD